MPRDRTMSPLVGSAKPARQRSKVVLPPPLPAIRPMRSVSPMDMVRFWNSGYGDRTPTPRRLMEGMVLSLGSMTLKQAAFRAGRRMLAVRVGQPCDEGSQGGGRAARMMLIVSAHAALPGW